MRGNDRQQNHIFSYLSPEQRVRKDHPLRAIRPMVDEVLKQLSPRFDTMYAKVGGWRSFSHLPCCLPAWHPGSPPLYASAWPMVPLPSMVTAGFFCRGLALKLAGAASFAGLAKGARLFR